MEEVDERAIFVRGPVVVFKWRNAHGWPVEYVSANAFEVFGHTAEAFLRGDVAYAAVIHPDDLDRVAREAMEASESGSSSFAHEPYRIRHRDGSIRWLYDFTRVLRDERGAATHFLGYVIDVTARVEAEAQARELERRLLHAQKLESLGVLAGGVAHDFNNLLTGILGHASLARRQLRESGSPALEAIEQIELLARSAADLTRQLLAYSGRGSFVVRPVDVGEIAREFVTMLGVALPRNAVLELDLAPSLPAVEADRGQMEQVVLNLLTNAGESLEGAAGTVRVRTRVEVLGADRLTADPGQPERAPGRYVVLEVSDTGCGMPEEVQRRLYDPFFTTKGAGRGLGMSAVQGIVHGHGGFVRVRSAPGRGTTFEIFLPATSTPTERPPPTMPVVGRPARGTVLVIDDEHSIRSSLDRLLRHLGYRAILAADGAEGLAEFVAHRDEIVAVLLDLTMPAMSGFETLEALRARSSTVPILLTSGYGDAATSGAAGATGFLPKPYGIEELERTLASVVRPS
ncbi:MAG: hypothetical protein OHK0013_14330 [Sandaracinaceae bacterium]